MADLVVGMAKSVVEGTLSKATAAIEAETTLRESAKRNLVFITGELEMMQSFLNVANAERVGNKLVLTRVRQIRELAYDVEDCVELVIHLDTNTSWLSWCRRMVPSCCMGAVPRPLDEAVDEIMKLKGRMADVSNRNARYNLISDTGPSPVIVRQERPEAAAAGETALGNNMLIGGARVTGRGQHGDLTQLLVDGNEGVGLISVWGSGGNQGVTSIIWKAFHAKQVAEKFTCRAWVKLVQPVHLNDVVQRVMDQFPASARDEPALKNDALYSLNKTPLAISGRRLSCLDKQLDEQRYLVVLEDLSTVIDWIAIRKLFLPTKNGSRIIVTTQQYEVASLCVGNPYTLLHLNKFSVDHTVYAFYNEESQREGAAEETGSQSEGDKKKAAKDWATKYCFAGRELQMKSLRDYAAKKCFNDQYQVMSVWGESALVEDFYRPHNNHHKFGKHARVDISRPFNLPDFCQILLSKLNPQPGSGDPIKECHRFLESNKCLIIIDGLKSKEEWDYIHKQLLPGCSSNCIIVTTTEETVAKYCSGDEKELMINVNPIQEEAPQSDEDKRKAADEVIKSLKNYAAKKCFNYQFHVMSVWGTGRVEKHGSDRRFQLGKSALVRDMFCQRILHDCDLYQNKKQFEMYGWVVVSHPFNSLEFCGNLLSSFNSQDIQPIENNYTDPSGSEDPIEKCLGVLERKRCFVVIYGLKSTEEWDLIRENLLPGRSKNCFIVITTEETVVKYCSGDEKELMIQVVAIEKEISQLDLGKMEDAGKWISHHDIRGRDKEMNDLRRRTTHVMFHSIQVMSVWGIAGVGKSSLVKNLFCDRIVNDYGLLEKKRGSIFEKYAWVDVSYPFNLKDFSQSLLLNFYSQNMETKETGSMEIDNPIQECRLILQNMKCLVVIDGLQSTDDWDLIHAEFVSGSRKTCIIIITTEESIAAHCGTELVNLNVKGLEARSAYDVFEKKVIEAHKGSLSYTEVTELETELKELVWKCGGLPKVITEISRSLCSKTPKLIESARSLSNEYMHSLEKNKEFDSLRSLFDWMQMYFHTCQDSIKPCIFYSSIFPGDRIIRRRRLIRRWIAEGYSRDNHEESAEENGEKQFSDLVDLSIILQPEEKIAIATQSDTTRMISCRVNGFIREYILSRGMEENLVFELGPSSTMTTKRTGRHLVILEKWKRDRTVFESMDFNRLRSLTVFGDWESFLITDSMKLLRVLDLENVSRPKGDGQNTSGLKEYDLKRMVKVLLRLKFLSLRGHHNICRLPGSLHKMRQLQTLDVRGTSITTLPEKITKLEKMQYIRAGTKDFQRQFSTASTVGAPAPAISRSGTVTEVSPPDSSSGCSWLPEFCICQRPSVGIEVPIGIGKLTALHSLGVVDVAASGINTIVKEFKKLTQLRKLGVSGINRKNSNKFFPAIEGHVHLESFSVQLDKEKNDNDNKDFLDGIIKLRCENLRSLKLYGLHTTLPNFQDNKLTKITKLVLEMASLTNEGTEILGKLPGLCILRVNQVEGCNLHFRVMVDQGPQDEVEDEDEDEDEDDSYKNLKVLEIACIMLSECSVKFGSKTMKKLELLKVTYPNAWPTFLFPGIENLAELKEVLLAQSNNAATQKEVLDRQLGNHPKSVKPVVNVEELPSST